jgi:hypothetical protein
LDRPDDLRGWFAHRTGGPEFYRDPGAPGNALPGRSAFCIQLVLGFQERKIEAARKLAEEQKQRAELSEQREKEQKEAAEKLGQAATKLQRRAIGAGAAAAAALKLLIVSIFMWHGAREQARIETNKAESPRPDSCHSKLLQNFKQNLIAAYCWRLRQCSSLGTFAEGPVWRRSNPSEML